jgi:glutaredoxin-like YruB-family protein
MAPHSGRVARITVYTTPVCPYCDHAKAYLTEHGLDFTEVDVSQDRTARHEMVAMTGQHGVPVVRVGEKAIVGWHPARFRELLEASERGR